MRATNLIGKFIVRTARIVGNPDAGETYLTLVTRGDSFWAVRTCHNSNHAFDTHMEMVEMAKREDAALCAEEAQRVQGFIEAGERLNNLVRRLTSHT